MKKTKKVWMLLLSACVLTGCVFGITACNPQQDSNSTESSSIADIETGDEMYFEVTNYELALGETITLSPVNGDSGIQWESTDNQVATVDASGVVTTLAIGETIIKATKDGEVAMCRIAVVAASAEAVLSLSLNKTSLTLYPGSTFTLKTTVMNGSTIVGAPVSYASTKENILTVDNNGVITAQAAGKAYVKVTAKYDGKTVDQYVTVNVKDAVNNLVVNIPSTQLLAGDSFELSASVLSGTQVIEEAVSDVTYTISDNNVATLSGNQIIGKAKGYVTVTATASYNEAELSYSFDLRVREVYTVKYSSDGVMLESFEVLDGEVFANQMEAPEKAENRFVYWSYQGNEYTFTEPVERNVHLIALWNPYDFTQSTYGAYVSYFVEENGERVEKIVEGGVSGDSRHEGGLRFVFVQEDGRQLLHLPRMKYCNYTKISFDWSIDGWAQFGQGEDLWYYQQGTMLEGTISIYHMGDGKTLYIELTGNNGTFGKYIEDEAIVNGEKSLPLVAHSYVPGRTFDMSPVFCSTEEVPNAVCGEKRVIAKQYESEDEFDNGWLFNIGEIYEGDWTLTLASMDYSQYESVTYRFRGSGAWLGIGFGPDKHFMDSTKDDNPLNGTITIRYNKTTGQYSVTIHDNGTNNTLTWELTDTEVIYGKKGFSFYVKAYAQYRNLIVGTAQTVDL